MYQSRDLDRAQQNKMAAGMEKLFLFGEEFEAILDILEDDEELQDEFTATAKDVSSKYPNLRRTIDSVINFRPPACALNETA